MPSHQTFARPRSGQEEPRRTVLWRRVRAAVFAGLAVVAGLAGVAAATGPAAAQLKITVTPGAAFTPMPIAVPTFTGDPQLGAQVSQIVAQDLKT
jgi:TolB protein